MLLPFVVMGFGVVIGYIKQDFGLTNFAVQFLPMMVLLWFFILKALQYQRNFWFVNHVHFRWYFYPFVDKFCQRNSYGHL